MDLGPNKKRFNKNGYQSGDQNAYQGSNYLLVSRVPIKEGTSTSISKYSQTPECHSVSARVIISETKGLSLSGEASTHTLVFTLAPDSSSPCAKQPPGAVSRPHSGRPRPAGPPGLPMLNLTAPCTLLSRFCSANHLRLFQSF